MGLDRVPVIMHFGPGSREPKRLENFNPLDAGALLNFFVSQSGSEMNIHEALKPEPNYNNLIFLTCKFVCDSETTACDLFFSDVMFEHLLCLILFNFLV